MKSEDKILYAGKYYSEIDITVSYPNGLLGLKRYDGVLLFHKDKDQFIIANQIGLIDDNIVHHYCARSVVKIINPFNLKDLSAINYRRREIEYSLDPYLKAIISNNGIGDYKVFPSPTSTVKKNSHWNDICKDCGAPAYVSLFSVECSNNCQGGKK